MHRLGFVRDLALFTAVFQMGRRDDDLHHAIGAGVMTRQRGDGFDPRVSGAQAVLIRPEPSCPGICPEAALTTYREADRSCHWNLGMAFLSPHMNPVVPVKLAKLDGAMNTQSMEKFTLD